MLCVALPGAGPEKMAAQDEDKLVNLLADGWSIIGYSTTIMAAGAMTHSMLLKKGSNLISATVVVTGEKEIGRSFAVLSPMPAAKNGWF
jgi:hypothetical protein